MSSLRLLSKLRRFKKGDNPEEYLSTQFRQSLKAIEDAFDDKSFIELEKDFREHEMNNYAVSSPVASYTNSTGTETLIASVELKTKKVNKGVKIGLASVGVSPIIYGASLATSGFAVFNLYRNDFVIWSTSTIPNMLTYWNSLDVFDVPPEGNQVYTLKGYWSGATGTAFFQNASLLAREL